MSNAAEPSSGTKSFCLKWALAGVSICGMGLLAIALTMAQQTPHRGQSNIASSAARFDDLLHEGFDLHRKTDYVHALPLLEQAWHLEPRDYFANLLVGIDLLRTGQTLASIRYLETASQLRPQEDTPFAYLGEAELTLGIYARAAVAYERAIHNDPKSEQGIDGWIDMSLQRFGVISTEMQDSDIGLAATYRMQARTFADDNPHHLERLEYSVSLDPLAPGVLTELAVAQIQRGKKDTARQTIARARTQPQRDANWALAVDCQDNSQSCSAADVLTTRRATSRTSKSEKPAHENSARRNLTDQDSTHRGIDLAEQQQCGQAIPLLESQLPAPAFAQSEVGKGVISKSIVAHDLTLVQQSDLAYVQLLLLTCYAHEVDVMSQRRQQLAGDDATSHMIQGDVFFRMRSDRLAAIREYQTALAMRPNDPNLLDRLSEAQLSDHQYEQARANAQASLALDPGRFSAIHLLARIALDQRNYSDALPYLKQLADRNPADASTQVDLGIALAQTGELKEAIAHLRPPLARGYTDPKGTLHYQLGLALRKAGDDQAARQALQRSSQLFAEYQKNSSRAEAEKQK